MVKLYVGNLAFQVSDDELAELFSSRGFKVESARVIRDMDTGRSRGFGFVELASGADMEQAVTQLNGFSMEGRALQVNEARPREERGGRGGFGGGRSGHRGRPGGGRSRF